MLLQRPHLMAEMPGLVDVAVAQNNRLVAAPAGVALAELIGFIGSDHLALGIVGKSELDTGSHELEKCDKEKSEYPLELFC